MVLILELVICRNGLQHRRNSWQDGVEGTNCPILPGKNFTYALQVKDQIGSFFYFPSLGMHKAAGAFGGIRIWSRPRIPVPFPPPAGEFTVLAGDWFKMDHHVSPLHSFQFPFFSLFKPSSPQSSILVLSLILMYVIVETETSPREWS